jgi:hypothetical protein
MNRPSSPRHAWIRVADVRECAVADVVRERAAPEARADYP